MPRASFAKVAWVGVPAVCECCNLEIPVHPASILHSQLSTVPKRLSRAKIREIYALMQAAFRDGSTAECRKCKEVRKYTRMYVAAVDGNSSLVGPLCAKCMGWLKLYMPDEYDAEVWQVVLTKASRVLINAVDTKAPLERTSLEIDVETLF